MRTYVIFALILTVMLAALPTGAAETGYHVGQQAPAFTGQTIDGKTVTLDDYKGKVLVFDFFATWCGPCMKALPDFLALADSADAGRVSFLINSHDSAKSKDKLVSLIEEKGIAFPVMYGDNDGNEVRVADLYGINYIPTLFVIDTKGRIAGKNLHGEDLAAFIDWLTTDPEAPGMTILPSVTAVREGEEITAAHVEIKIENPGATGEWDIKVTCGDTEKELKGTGEKYTVSFDCPMDEAAASRIYFTAEVFHPASGTHVGTGPLKFDLTK